MSKTWKRPVTIYYTATAADASAGSATIGVSSGQLPTDDFKFMSAVTRTGVLQTAAKSTYSSGTGALTLEDDGAYTVTAGDLFVAIGTYA